ncbi:MAG: family 1 encapsulin nanocompartment shell protein [Sphaerochaetaceae bacterium]
MDMLKKELAPLTSHVWEEIEQRAAEVLRSRLSARKVIHVKGPLGWEHAAVAEGRLDVVDESGDVKVGVYRIAPLSEVRVRFSLNRWEMDNLNRGAKDIDLDALDEAAEKIAEFEERAIYNGFKEGGIVGLAEASGHKSIAFGKDGQSIMQAVTEALVVLKNSHAKGPYSLVVGTKAYMALNKEMQGIPLTERIERLIGGKVVHSLVTEEAFLLPYDHEDLEMTIGQDFAIGYETHDTKEVTLFLTESFTPSVSLIPI